MVSIDLNTVRISSSVNLQTMQQMRLYYSGTSGIRRSDIRPPPLSDHALLNKNELYHA